MCSSHLRFDQYDHNRQFPTCRELQREVCYRFLVQQESEPPVPTEQKREHSKATAARTRPSSVSSTKVSNLTKFRKRQFWRNTDRSNNRQAVPTSDIYSATFQMSIRSITEEIVNLPTNIGTFQGDIFPRQARSFGTLCLLI